MSNPPLCKHEEYGVDAIFILERQAKIETGPTFNFIGLTPAMNGKPARSTVTPLG
ncbi:MAG: hypothetical protein KJ804_08570 [Proteobacteria bacterium]|nr:hypothetical protein [Pseudomonadota bacterium]MBU1058350.1 hypothetical protein [Pseudomonadota bacterium]